MKNPGMNCAWLASRRNFLGWRTARFILARRFGFFVGRRCRTATISHVARELHLDWRAVKELDKQYMTLARAPQAAILFDKFHIIRHLGEALDKVRKSE